MISRIFIVDPYAGSTPHHHLGISVQPLNLELLLRPQPVLVLRKEFDVHVVHDCVFHIFQIVHHFC